jgi:protein-S-isoprenylcysteine O-methyltransferase Ste14
MQVIRFIKRTPISTFVLSPLVVLVWETVISRGHPLVDVRFLPVMLWGFLEYYLCGRYRIKHGGGGPGINTPPDHLVSQGPYAFTRNPMYLGHIIYLIGLTLVFRSWLGLLISILRAIWFHRRVLNDEKNLPQRLGQPYLEYRQRVKRWIPGLF